MLITNERYDDEIKDLIPHREPMLLINKVAHLEENSSSAYVYIDDGASFYEQDKGIAAWVGLEYMGQTAALMGGYRLREGLIQPHLGILLGTRKFITNVDYFESNTTLKVSCKQDDVIGDSLATFACSISYHEHENKDVLATATLSIFRQLK